MQNRSGDALPAFFISYDTFSFQGTDQVFPVPLEIYDFTFLHFHDFLEIGYCVEGKGICRVGDTEYPFQKGDFQIIFPFQQHLSRNYDSEDSQWYWFNINPYELMEISGFAGVQKIERMILEEMGLCGIFPPDQYPEIAKLADELLHEISNLPSDTPYHAELCASYLYQILICLARRSQNLPKLNLQKDRRLPSLTPALNLISESVKSGTVPTVEALAASSGMSVSHFRRLFHSAIGLAPKDYITKSFLYKAQQLLMTTQKSILEISMETGFRDISGFNRQFLSKTGMTPLAFRKKYGNSRYIRENAKK